MWLTQHRRIAKTSVLSVAGLICLAMLLSIISFGKNRTSPEMRVAPESNLMQARETEEQLKNESTVEPSHAAKDKEWKADHLVVNADFQVGDLPAFPEFRLVGFTQDDNGQSHPQANWNQQRHMSPRLMHEQGGSAPPPARFMMGVDGNRCDPCKEPRWNDATMIPWERFSYGEYIGPHRTPHVPEYRIRVRDQLDFVFMMTREQTGHEYRFGVGDTLAIVSSIHVEYNQPSVLVLSDGSISLPLIGRVMVSGKSISVLEKEINDRYIAKGVRMPQIVVQGKETNRRLQDLRDAVDARAGVGGQSRAAEVGPDGTIQLPLIHSVPAIGLTLKELAREVNARYREKIEGIEVTPILVQRAPRVAYVVGEVVQPGRIDLLGPTSAIQAIALAQGWNIGGNLRQVIVFRRDQNWNLMATRLDLSGALFGKRPHPSDEIWLRDGDIVLIPKQPILRLADAIDLYFTRTLFSIVPNQGFALNFDSNSGIN